MCDAAAENGCRVHWGAGDELGRLLPLLPLLEALRAERSEEGQAVLRLLRGEVPTVLDPSAVAAERVLGMVEVNHALSDPDTTGRVRARLLVLNARAHCNLGDADAAEKTALDAARDVRQLAEHVGNTVRLAQAQSALVQMSYDSGCSTASPR